MRLSYGIFNLIILWDKPLWFRHAKHHKYSNYFEVVVKTVKGKSWLYHSDNWLPSGLLANTVV